MYIRNCRMTQRPADTLLNEYYKCYNAGMYKTAVRKVGNSLGITLPKSLVANLHLQEGEEVNLVETSEGLLLTPYNPEFGKWAQAYEKTNRKYRNTLKRLSE